MVPRNTNDRRVGNEWVREEDRLELSRRDLESFILDQILLAVDDVDFAISKFANVACAEPAVEKGVAGCLRVVVVAAGDNGAFAEDLAGRAGWDVVEIFVDDPARWVRSSQRGRCAPWK
jgi:hypothetical protein